MRTLLLDIETAPNKAYVWGLFDQNIAHNQLEASSYVLCWVAQWWGQKGVIFDSIRHKGGPRRMLQRIHALLDMADTVVHYNGLKFDIPTLNKEFVKYGLGPPAPYKQVDLMQVCKHRFRFESNKLAYVSETLGLGAKVKHEGFTLWVRCMEGDKGAWGQMEEYNRRDVEVLGELYKRLLPWIEKHPNHSALGGIACCPKCGSARFQSRGEALTSTLRYQRFQCQECGAWFRGTKTTSQRGAPRMTNIVER